MADEEVMEPSFSGVIQAAQRLKSVMRETPLVRSEPLSQITGADVWLKLETASPIGSFKIRGAANALFKSKQFQKTKHAFAASSGNHGQGVALSARRLGGTSCIFVPENPNLVKTAKMEKLGAKVVEQGAGFDEAREAALEAQSNCEKLFLGEKEEVTEIPAISLNDAKFPLKFFYLLSFLKLFNSSNILFFSIVSIPPIPAPKFTPTRE